MLVGLCRLRGRRVTNMECSMEANEISTELPVRFRTLDLRTEILKEHLPDTWADSVLGPRIYS